MNAQTRATIDLMVLMMATLSGIAVAILAVLIGGGGHGWLTPRFSAGAIVLAPLGAIAWCYRDRPMMRTIARAVTALNLLLDAAVVIGTYREGLQYASQAFSNYAPAIMVWAVVWVLWQIPPATAVTRLSARSA
jgi:hypothetical protein